VGSDQPLRITCLYGASTTNTFESFDDGVIGADPNLQARLVDLEFRRHLFFLGGVPRPSVMFALGKPFDVVWEMYVERKWSNELSPEDCLLLIATAVKGAVVLIGASSGSENRKWVSCSTKVFACSWTLGSLEFRIVCFGWLPTSTHPDCRRFQQSV
jgi:hypothetical protein